MPTTFNASHCEENTSPTLRKLKSWGGLGRVNNWLQYFAGSKGEPKKDMKIIIVENCSWHLSFCLSYILLSWKLPLSLTFGSGKTVTQRALLLFPPQICSHEWRRQIRMPYPSNRYDWSPWSVKGQSNASRVT